MNTSKPAAIILGDGWNALGQARAFGEIGVPCYMIVSKGGPGAFAGFTRHARKIHGLSPVSEPARALQLLLNVASDQATKPMLMFTDDAWMSLVGHHEQEVRRVCHIPQGPWEQLGPILNKRTLYEMAMGLGIPVPHGRGFASISAMLDALDQLPDKSIVKPEITVNFLERIPAELKAETHHRTRLCESRADLERWGGSMVRGGLDVAVVVQDYIPGGAEALYTLTSYSDASGRMLAGSVGHKVHQFPPDAGCIVTGRLEHQEQVFEQGRWLLDGLRFHGFANTEFKYDPRDGSYRLMEINPRLGMWNGSALWAGVNLPAIAYGEMLGQAFEGPEFSTAADGALWIGFWDDAMNCLYRCKSNGYMSGHLGLRGWIRSLRGPRIPAIWRWTDPMPAFMHFFDRLGLLAGHVAGRVRKKARRIR